MGDRYHPSGLPDPGDEGEELFPDRRKHGYKELEDKLDKHATEIKDRLAIFIRRGLIAFAIVGVFTTLALFGFGYLLREQHKTTDLIQEQRRDAVRTTCEEQNKRHDRTVAVLERVLRDAEKKTPERKAQIEAARASNLLLINALAPHRDCAQLIHLAVPEVNP
jgi:hypothetical protein